jgi:hypothetical protein
MLAERRREWWDSLTKHAQMRKVAAMRLCLKEVQPESQGITSPPQIDIAPGI